MLPCLHLCVALGLPELTPFPCCPCCAHSTGWGQGAAGKGCVNSKVLHLSLRAEGWGGSGGGPVLHHEIHGCLQGQLWGRGALGSGYSSSLLDT